MRQRKAVAEEVDLPDRGVDGQLRRGDRGHFRIACRGLEKLQKRVEVVVLGEGDPANPELPRPAQVALRSGGGVVAQ